MISVAVVEQCDDAVLAHTSTRSWRLSTPIGDAADLQRLAERLETHQLWLHPSWSKAHPIDIPPWSAARTSNGQLVQICAPLEDKLGMGALGTIADGRTLLGALLELEHTLGVWWRGTPGATGSAILRDTLRRRGVLSVPVDLPPPALSRGGQEGDFGWLRPLSDAEQGRQWLHAFDKHGQYLVAAGTVELGVGDVELVPYPTFQARSAGYWHVLTLEWPADRLLPDPTRRGPLRPSSERSYRWLTTPSVEAGYAADTIEHIAAAWIWPKHGRHLQQTADILRKARARFERRADPVGRAALATIKPVYTAMFGRLAWSELRQSEPSMYRPDWFAMLKAEARARLWYQLRNLEQAGCAAAAIATDCIFLASDAADPTSVMHGVLELGPAPRQWAHLGRVPLADVLELFDRPGYATRLATRFRELSRDA